MAGKTYTISQFADALSNLEKHVRSKVIEKAAMAGGFTIEAYAKINVEKTFKSGTGNLANSIITTLEKSSDTEAKVSVGPTIIYGRIQELGGVIKPIKGKHLAIPTKNAPKGSSPRDFNDLFFLMSHTGDGGVMINKAGVVMFVLKTEVFIPARPYLRPAVDENEAKIIKAVSVNLRIEIEAQI